MRSNHSIILGLSLGHGDSSAALLMDGCLIAAAEEERFTRVKHYALFPKQAIQYCLTHAKIRPSDVQVVAIARKPWNAFGKRFALFLQHPSLMNRRIRSSLTQSKQPSFRHSLNESGIRNVKITQFEHHLAHMMSARYLSSEDDISLLSFDGLGDFVSAAIGRSMGKDIEVLDRVYFPHSLGYFYTAMTQYLGFPHFGDEFKVMGLSSFGQPRFLYVMRELIRESDSFGFQLNGEAFPVLKQMNFSIDKGQPKIKPFYNSSFLTQVLGVSPRKVTENLTRQHWDLARSVQVRFEEIANHLLTQLFERVGTNSVGIAGGCAHNSVWVGKIPQNTPFKNIFVSPASNDAGIAVGAAALAARVEISPEGKHWALLGPDENDSVSPIHRSLPFQIREQSFQTDESLIQWMVDELRGERIIGLLRGRMEFGPRALGSRSILCDPRNAKMKDRLNERIKHRELFRPFAASVLWEHQEDWFENSFFCPSMEAVFEAKSVIRNKIPAVVHVDNSCRVQSVVRESQPFFWYLINAFRKKTGIPLLLNTSFNDCEPIVCSENDAWECFMSCDMDHLVIGHRAYSRIREIKSAAND